MKISRSQLPANIALFHAQFTQYLMDRAAHKYSVGVAAPFPPLDVMRPLAEAIEAGDSLEIVDDVVPANDDSRDAPTSAPQEVGFIRKLWRKIW